MMSNLYELFGDIRVIVVQLLGSAKIMNIYHLGRGGGFAGVVFTI